MKRLIASLIASAALLIGAPAFADKPDILETIQVKGVIEDGMADMITSKVEEINDNPRVKAVLLEVDSPGGGVLPSAVIYEELSKLKVPIVGYCQNICASGGMYILMAPPVKFIGVRSETISGSIGVVMHIMRYNRLLDWAKIDASTYKSGVSKDTGNPERAETPEDKVELQGEIDTLAGRFYDIVQKGRGSKIKDMAQVKTARVFFGVDGVKAGLVDAVMSKDAAIVEAKHLSGSKNIFTREELKKMSKDNSNSGDYAFETPKPTMSMQLFNDFEYAVRWIKEIRQGQSIKLEYIAPYAND